MSGFTYNDELCHHGIKGQKWGVRRYQNSDGSLTPAGLKRYGYGEKLTKAGQKAYLKEYKKLFKLKNQADINVQRKNLEKYNNRASKAAKVGIGLAGAAAVNHLGGTKLVESLIKSKYANDKAISQALYDREYKSILKDFKGEMPVDSFWANYQNKQLLGAKSKYYDRLSDSRKEGLRIANIQKGVTYALAGGAAVSLGVAGYNKIRAHTANKLLSEVGHNKAVAKYKAQVDKMQTMFGDVKISDIMKKE